MNKIQLEIILNDEITIAAAERLAKQITDHLIEYDNESEYSHIKSIRQITMKRSE